MLICPDSLNYDKVMTVVRMSFPDPYVVKARYLCRVDVVPSLSLSQNTDWNKYDDRLMKAVERGEVDKVAAVLSKKGIIPTKLDMEGRSA